VHERRHPAHDGRVHLVIPDDDRRVCLDPFSCGGGAARGYLLAGLWAICVDRDDHAASIAAIGGEFHRMDWREGLRRFAHLADFIHASPPCQHDSIMSQCRPGLRELYPDLVAEVREGLVATGKPWVIEQPDSVRMRAKMKSPVMLCGTMFGLAVSIGVSTWELRRHRLFESGMPLLAPRVCDHQLRPGSPRSPKPGRR
jgi:DNA (cytosine-5)-methyltransferase 1